VELLGQLSLEINICCMPSSSTSAISAAFPLGSVELLAVCHPSTPLSRGRTIEVARLADFPLLLMDSGFGFRRAFDAASRMADLKPTIMLESRNPHTLLALAESGHGVAIVP
jgi:LysR family nitrogen assimilation transcriptional regulator